MSPPCGGTLELALPTGLRLPLGLGSADEELGTICVGASVGHGQDARACVLQDEVLIGELLPIDGFAAGAVVAREVATLQKRRFTSPTRQAGAQSLQAELPSHPDLPAPSSETQEKHQIPPTHLPAAAGAPRTWHMNPGMILWKQDPL